MDTKVMVVGSTKASYTNTERRRPRIRLAGFWLNEIGFEYEKMVTVEYQNGRINLKLQGSGIETYKNLVKEARKSGLDLIKVENQYHNKKLTPHLEIKGFRLNDLGFNIGSVILVRFEYGHIEIILLDISKLAIGQ